MTPEGEIRQNKATGQWVIYAPGRGKRPKDMLPRRARFPVPVWEPTCPFCPGNEHMLPAILMEMPGAEGKQWQTRVVPNKFPALSPQGETHRVPQGLYVTMPSAGRHEVIIESPRHDQQLADLSADAVRIIIETYHRRYAELMQAPHAMLTLLFRNHGELAGTSLRHAHAQVIVTSIVPPLLRWKEAEAQRYFDTWGRCVYCDILAFERQERCRVVLENAAFPAFIPFAAEVPCEIWLLPKRHQADFGAITAAEKTALALALHDVLARLHAKLGDPDYNYIINTSIRYRAEEPHLHWYLQIRPRLTTPAGFEIGSGMSLNSSLPENAMSVAACWGIGTEVAGLLLQSRQEQCKEGA